MAAPGTTIDTTISTKPPPKQPLNEVDVLGKNGINMNNLHNSGNWVVLPCNFSTNPMYYTHKSYPEPPEQNLIPSFLSNIAIAYAFVHQWDSSEHSVAWITGDVARFQGAKFRVLLATYDLSGEEFPLVLLAHLDGEWKPKKGKYQYCTKDNAFVLVLLSDFTFCTEHTNDACISNDELSKLREKGLKACVEGLQHHAAQGSTTTTARRVCEFELTDLNSRCSSYFP